MVSARGHCVIPSAWRSASSAWALNGCAAYLARRALRRSEVRAVRALARARAVAWRCSADVSVVVLTFMVICLSLVSILTINLI